MSKFQPGSLLGKKNKCKVVDAPPPVQQMVLDTINTFDTIQDKSKLIAEQAMVEKLRADLEIKLQELDQEHQNNKKVIADIIDKEKKTLDELEIRKKIAANEHKIKDIKKVMKKEKETEKFQRLSVGLPSKKQ